MFSTGIFQFWEFWFRAIALFKLQKNNPSTFIGRASREGLEQIYTVSFNLYKTAAARVCVLASQGERQTTQRVHTMQDFQPDY